jgi:hypothetical protein
MNRRRATNKHRKVSPAGNAVSPASPSAQVLSFLSKFEPPVARLIKQCRSEIRKLFPTALELVYDNYNFFVIGYSATERPSDCIVSLAAAANGVGLSFYYGSTLPDPQNLLLGSGKQNRFIRLPSVEPLRSPGVLALIRAAVRQARTPLAASGRGRTIIKSVSAKQRPRRRSK